MNMNRLHIMILSAAAYFYFHWGYFALIAASLQLPHISKGIVTAAYFINFILFFVCSILELNLVVNWALFFLLLLIETELCCGKRRLCNLYFPQLGILGSLTSNIFCRCVAALVLAQPLSAFDNHVRSEDNLKSLPVVLGFLLGGAILRLMAKQRYTQKIRTLFGHPRHLAFQLELMGGMFFYLFLNLLLYQSRENGILLKLWGIKSCLFSVAGTYLGFRYSLKMCERAEYLARNRAIQRELTQKEREEQSLKDMAYRDMLTGAYNRQYAVESVKCLVEQHADFALCFVDLDNLKMVNDRYGHAEGDRYLVTVAGELGHTCRKGCDLLFRYGGDEFLILFMNTLVPAAEERLGLVNRRLARLSEDGEVPFVMSVSYGAVDSGSAGDAEQLIADADEKMYGRKRKKS